MSARRSVQHASQHSAQASSRHDDRQLSGRTAADAESKAVMELASDSYDKQAKAWRLVNHFKHLYQDSDVTRAACGLQCGSRSATALGEPLTLADVYSEKIVLRDPLHEVHGLNDLRSYMRKMYSNVSSCRFIYHDEWVADGNAAIKWDMVFKHRRLGGGKEITVRGMTHISFGDRVDYHEDVFDAGAMIYQNLPVLGRSIQWLKSRLN